MFKLFTLVALLGSLILSAACGSSNSSKITDAPKAPVVKAQSQPEPAVKKPELTPEQKAEAMAQAKADRIKAVKQRANEIFQEEWKREVEGVSICTLEYRLSAIRSLMGFEDSYENRAYETGEEFTLTWTEVGLDEKTVKAEHLKTFKQWTIAVIDVVKNGSKIDSCGRGEGATDLNDRCDLVTRIYEDLDGYNLKPADVGLSAPQLRELIKLAARKDFESVKKGGHEGWRITNAINTFNLTAEDIGATEEEFTNLANS